MACIPSTDFRSCKWSMKKLNILLHEASRAVSIISTIFFFFGNAGHDLSESRDDFRSLPIISSVIAASSKISFAFDPLAPAFTAKKIIESVR